MKERLYTAYVDNGRDFVTFEFYSCHRANSKANIEDAQKEHRRKHGHRVARIINTFLY